MVHRTKPHRIFALVAVYLAVAVACGSNTDIIPRVDNALVRLGSAEFVCEVARTSESRSLGLSGREYLSSGRGMLFDMETATDAIFWMKGMRFPIDIVWISSDLVVIDVDRNVPVPNSALPDTALPLYHQEGLLSRYVLELNAGTTAEHGIVKGLKVTIQDGDRLTGGHGDL
jgi:uncharacterized membrane protein (UPF0127 family)